MAFILRKGTDHTRKIDLGGGLVLALSFTAKASYDIAYSLTSMFMSDSAEGRYEVVERLLRTHVVGWEGVEDEDGAAVEFSPTALFSALDQDPGLLLALQGKITALAREVLEDEKKDSEPSRNGTSEKAEPATARPAGRANSLAPEAKPAPTAPAART